MATTTTNFGWDIPESTDLVKDGATAIAALGQDIDTALIDLKGGTTGQVLTKASGTDLDFTFATPGSGALTFIKSQTIGSAVSSVTVTDAFSATYDNYLIVVSDGVGSTNANGKITLGGTTSGYFFSGYFVLYSTATVTAVAASNVASWDATRFSTNAHSGHINLQNPFLSKNTTMHTVTIGAKSDNYAANYAGFLNDTTSYTDFTITTNTGTMTGGTIRVYGYQNS